MLQASGRPGQGALSRHIGTPEFTSHVQESEREGIIEKEVPKLRAVAATSAPCSHGRKEGKPRTT